VVSTRVRDRSGKLPVKFLITLAVLAGVVYYGIGVVRSYAKFYQLKDEVRVQARFAGNLTDEDIRRRLRTRATELQLPAEAQRVTVQRRGRPREVVVTVSWPDTINLPFYRWTHTYRVEVRAPL
jgi:hypothetical protein